MGISENGRAAHCWRCGTHPVRKVLSYLLNVSEDKISVILKPYKGDHYRKKIEEPVISIHPLKYPKPSGELMPNGKKYLERRGFDPDKLEREWKLGQTGPVSFLDKISYNHRILIPIHWDGRMVSFQGRDITDKSELKYLACPKKRERRHHKDIVYGKSWGWKDLLGSIIVVEGVTDVWRLGVNSVATFGIEFKMSQVLEMASLWERFFIVFDDEPQAQKQAKVLAVKLKALGKQAFIETIQGDPGGMKQDDADHFVRQLLGRG